MKKLEFKLPTPMLIGSAYKFWRSEIEFEKARLIAASMNAPEPVYHKPEIDVLVPLAVYSREMSVSTRTVMRRIKETEDSRGDAS